MMKTTRSKQEMEEITGTGYKVNTILRSSSAANFPGEYYETLVFDLNDLIEGKIPRIIDQAESGIKSVAEKNHQTMVVKYSWPKS